MLVKYLFYFCILFLFFVQGCEKGICIGDCSFDMDVDIGLFIHQPSDFNNTRVRVKIPASAVTIKDNTLHVVYRNINRHIHLHSSVSDEFTEFHSKEIYLFISIMDGEMLIKGIRH